MGMKRKLPNSTGCFVCGVENQVGLQLLFYVDKDDRVVTDVTIPEHFAGYPGMAHGGIVSTILDETLARAVMVEDPNRFVFTGRLTIRYRRPTPTETSLMAVGEVKKDRGRMVECASFLYGPEGELLAEAEALLFEMSAVDVPAHPFSEDDWKIIPDD